MADRTTKEEEMNRFDSSLSLKGLFSGDNKKSTLIFLVSTIVIVTWKYYGTKAFFLAHLTSHALFNNPDWTGATYSFVTGLLLFGFVPVVIVKFVFNESLSHYGVQIGDWKFGLVAAAVMAPVMIALTYPSSSDPRFLAEYPLFKGAGASAAVFAGHSLLYLTYYLGYEMLMRGFIQFGLREQLGDWNAILVQTAVSTLFHIGKPDGEIFSSILGGLIWGIVVFRSRSLLYVLIVHWLLGVSLDFFICFSH
ncbi:MAG TPA: type II CAAX endopeptidase family protein [Bacteroidota bacterium]